MPASTADADHPARALSEGERIDYLTVIASLVVADAHVDEAELAALNRLCRALGLSDDAEKKVMDSARSPDRTAVDRALASVAKVPALRTSLLADAIVMVFADGKVSPEESDEVVSFARKLGLSQAQTALIARHVEAAIREDVSSDDRPTSVGVTEEPANLPGADDTSKPRYTAVSWLRRTVAKK